MNRFLLSLTVLACSLSVLIASAQRPDRKISWVNPKIANVRGLEHKVLASTSLGHDVGYAVWTPPKYDANNDTRYPVVYFLHGAGGTEASDSGGFSSRVAGAVRAGTFPEAICVFPNGGMSFYRGDVESMIIDELIPLIDRDYRTKAKPAGRALAGFSMGGAGSVRLALLHPELFCAAGSWGGALSWRGNGEDSPLIPAAKSNVGTLKLNRFALLTINGDKDHPEGFTPLNKILKAEGIPHKVVTLEDTKHNLGHYYERSADTLLEFLSDRLQAAAPVTLNLKAEGYRGIWYMNSPSKDEYAYKYSGGLGTYCAKHKPFAIYSPQVNKTFFCYGGARKDNSRKLLHMVSYFDHATRTVPRPTILLDKKTSDAHDNPVISIDGDGHLWIFSTSHGRTRPSHIHRSVRPYDIEEFELVSATRIDGDVKNPINNFSYLQAWHSKDNEFQVFFTRYGYPAKRTICFMNSRDGVAWSEWQRIAAIEEGHYQISGIGKSKIGSFFNFHPKGKGLNWRTNLYYVESPDGGRSWQTVDKKTLTLPLTTKENSALIYDYQTEGLNVYLKDLRFDEHDRPVLLYITSKGYQSGPGNDPRTWTIARWTGDDWIRSEVTTSDNNYDFGELWMITPNDWRIIGPTETGPQVYNPGGEIAMWTSQDQGATWKLTRQMTSGSSMNHTYVRRALNAHPDFIGIWADGHGRKPSDSSLYFTDREGTVFKLPETISGTSAAPVVVESR
ncbi:MAG: BNR-4 repeat-containing protein [Rubripirellula sp.]